MRIAAAFLAEAISINGGVVDVQRGWPEWWNIETIPGKTDLLVGLIVEFEPAEIGVEAQLTLNLRQQGNDSGSFVVSLVPERHGDPIAAVPFHHPLYFKMEGVPVNDVGPCEIAVLRGTEELALVRFVARLKPVEG